MRYLRCIFIVHNKIKALLLEADCGWAMMKKCRIYVWKSCNILLKNIRLSLGNKPSIRVLNGGIISSAQSVLWRVKWNEGCLSEFALDLSSICHNRVSSLTDEDLRMWRWWWWGVSCIRGDGCGRDGTVNFHKWNRLIFLKSFCSKRDI